MDASPATPRSRRQRRRDATILRDVLTVASGLSFLATWLPGIGGMVLLVCGIFVPALALIGGLILLQWPLMLVALRLNDTQRTQRRHERRSLRPLTQRVS